MSFLTMQAYWRLLYFDFLLMRGDFAGLYARIRNLPTAKGLPSSALVKTICSAVDIACICYPKQVLCLQRSATTVSLLKNYAVPATLVLGAQQMPFKAHAWVEVDGCVVNDKAYTPEIYGVLDRC